MNELSPENELLSQLDEMVSLVPLFINSEYDECYRLLRKKYDCSMHHNVGLSVLMSAQSILEMNKTLMADTLNEIEMAITTFNEKYRLKHSIFKRKHFGNKSEHDNEHLSKAELVEIEKELIAELYHSMLFVMSSFLAVIVDQHLTAFVRAVYRMTSGYMGLKESLHIVNTREYWSTEGTKHHYECLVKFYVGLFELVISVMPSKLSKLLGLIGFTGQMNTALDYFHRCISLKKTFGHTSASFLMLFYEAFLRFFYGNGDFDEKLLHEMFEEFNAAYPKSLVTLTMSIIDKFMNGNFLESKNLTPEVYSLKNVEINNEFIIKYSENNDQHNCHIPHYIRNILIWTECWNLAFLNEWPSATQKAKTLYQTCKWSPVLFNYIYFAMKLMEIRYSDNIADKNVELEKLCEHVRQIPLLKRKIGGYQVVYEAFVLNRCKKFLKNPHNEDYFPLYELAALWHFFAILCKSEQSKMIALKNIDERINAYKESKYSDDHLNLLHMKAIILRYSKNYTEAEQLLLKVLNSETKIKKDKYLLPHSAIELGYVYKESNDLENARKWISVAKNDYSGYVSESLIRYRADLFLDELNG